MMVPSRKRDIVLAVHPSATGMGWTAFEGPLALHDWGLFTAKFDKNGKCLRKLERLMKRLEPQVLVLEVFDDGRRRRAWRVRTLCEAMVRLAAERGAHVEIYGRDEVADALGGVRTREQIAAAVVRVVQDFGYRLPPHRRPWMSEDPRLALFSAAALALTHYRQEAEQVLRDKRR